MPNISFTPYLKGGFTTLDLLGTETCFTFPIASKQMLRDAPLYFTILDDEFVFSFSCQNDLLVLQRNETVSILDITSVPENTGLYIYVGWSFTQLTLICAYKVTEPV